MPKLFKCLVICAQRLFFFFFPTRRCSDQVLRAVCTLLIYPSRACKFPSVESPLASLSSSLVDLQLSMHDIPASSILLAWLLQMTCPAPFSRTWASCETRISLLCTTLSAEPLALRNSTRWLSYRAHRARLGQERRPSRIRRLRSMSKVSQSDFITLSSC